MLLPATQGERRLQIRHCERHMVQPTPTLCQGTRVWALRTNGFHQQ
jgi:hypothetical protein